MAFNFIKASSISNVVASPAAPVFTGGNTAGNLIIVAAIAFVQTGEFITSITDSQGNSYVSANTGHVVNPAGQISFWYANNIIGGAGNNTVTINYSGGNRTTAVAIEYSGQSVSNPVDVPSFSSASTGGAFTLSYTSTCATAGELLLSLGVHAGGANWSALSGTARGSVTNQFIVPYDVLSSLSGANSVSQTCSDNVQGSASIAFIPAPTTFSVSGNAGTAGATVSWSGTSSGSVAADGSGNYTIPGLANGPYTITPSKTNFTFSPVSSNQTVSGANITGVNFIATQVLVYSVPDCRVAPFGPNASRTVQGTAIYDVQTSDNATIPPVDSRAAGAPVDSRVASIIPQNSRTPGTFGPGE